MAPIFQIGDRVVVHSLLKASHLNGRHGCVGGAMDSSSGRYPIDFDTWTTRVMAKTTNLRREPTPDEEKSDKEEMRIAEVENGVLVE